VRDTWFTADKPGTYRGQCAELCGKDHGFMPIVVKAVSKEEFTRWLAAQKAKSAPAATPAAPAAAEPATPTAAVPAPAAASAPAANAG
jgi:cytochrome c oxidase subunit II